MPNTSHNNYQISGSIIAADYANLGKAIQDISAAGIDFLHFDVMDHHYVPNLTLGPSVLEKLQAVCNIPVDAHLMVDNPDIYIDAFAKAGARYLTVHPETCADLSHTLEHIRNAGMLAGVAFNPDQDACSIQPYLNKIDMILQMSVFPGFSGQSFIPETLERIAACRAMLDAQSSSIVLAVDGGIKTNNIAAAANAGARFFVMGSGLFNTADMKQRAQDIRAALK